MTLRLLGKASSINVRKVLWTCEETGRAHAREDWGTRFASAPTPGPYVVGEAFTLADISRPSMPSAAMTATGSRDRSGSAIGAGAALWR
ncbi:hypothetical protein [Falsiroseomonas sp. HW251]|uniref:hypothetical protein n=1 Tax=Falsiroseomonas sp. HW251 TaxID=3390998 RepID=UPI003D323388